MKDYTKVLVVKFAILIALGTIGGATFYFMQEYSFNKAFQLATLLGVGVLAVALIGLYILGIIFDPLVSKLGIGIKKSAPASQPSEEEVAFAIPKEERIVRHATKEEYVERLNQLSEIDLANQKLQEMASEIGKYSEVMLLLPQDLAFLITKEAVERLAFGKIKEENMEAGTLLAQAGFWLAPQQIQISVQPITNNSTVVRINSKSASGQSEKKDAKYIQKITDFIKEKEQFYME